MNIPVIKTANKNKKNNKPTEDDIIREVENTVRKDTRISRQQMMWLLCILGILRRGGYARVMTDCCLIDVEALMNTHEFCSFYDVYNNLGRFVTTVQPVRVDKLENGYTKMLKSLW